MVDIGDEFLGGGYECAVLQTEEDIDGGVVDGGDLAYCSSCACIDDAVADNLLKRELTDEDKQKNLNLYRIDFSPSDILPDEFFDGIKENAVDIVDNFDGTEKEPTLLPVKFPSILVNDGYA